MATRGQGMPGVHLSLTTEQSMAVHESEVALVARLIAAMEAGDPKARQAYELRRKARRD